MNKPELRRHMRKRRRALSERAQASHGLAFREQLIRTAIIQKSRSIGCYLPVSGELDTQPLMHYALDTGRKIYLPTIDGDRMWFSRWHGQALHTQRSAKLPQPLKRQTRLLNVRSLDLIIVPLVAFSRSGKRLGQGGGYYDRTFGFQCHQRWLRPTLIGAAHDLQEHDSIPTDPWDVPLLGIVTNKERIL